MNLFQWPGVSVINTANIFCYMKVSFCTFKICWNMYFLNYLCLTWSIGWHLVDSSIALFLKSLTLPSVCAFILSKLLIALMGFPRLGASFSTQTTHECTQSKLKEVRHAWYVVSQCGPLDSGGLNGRLSSSSHQVIWGSVICCNFNYTAISKLKTIMNFHQICA